MATTLARLRTSVADVVPLQGQRLQLRVVVVAACPLPLQRGTPVRILRSAEAVAERGHNVRIVTYHLGDETITTPLQVERTPRLPTYKRLAPGPSYQKLLFLDPLLIRKLVGVLKTAPVDIVHAHHYEGLLVALVARGSRRIPIVYDAHTTLASELHHYGLGMTRTFKQRIGVFLDRVLPGAADAVITVSTSIQSSLAPSISSGVPIEVIANGVEYDHFVVDDVPTDPRRLIFSGNLASYQRIDLMLESFRRVLERRPEARLQIALNEPAGPFHAMAARYDISHAVTVVQVGFDELPKLLSSAAIALNPRTECDGLPQKVLNYMASGRAIVSSEGSAKHLIHGDTALIVPNDDVETFAASIVTLLDDPGYARRLGDAARRAVRTTFSWADAAQRIEDVYFRTILAQEARRAAAV